MAHVNSQQQGDVLLVGSFDQAGDAKGQPTCVITGGLMSMTGGFETAALLSLWGGNRGDDGIPGNPLTYWGNLGENDPSRRYVSRVQNLFGKIPLVTATLNVIKEAAAADLLWFVEESIASSVDVVVTMPAVNRVTISGSIFADGAEHRFEFTENWRAMQ